MEGRVERSDASQTEPTSQWIINRARELSGGAYLSIAGYVSYQVSDVAMQVAAQISDPDGLERAMAVATAGTTGAIAFGGLGLYLLSKSAGDVVPVAAAEAQDAYRTWRERTGARNH